MTRPADPVAIARELLCCPSVTPVEGGALAYLERVLGGAGFTVHRPVFSEPGTADVENLYARIGTGAPHLCFAGHTDVVPPGDTAAWTHGPFAGEIASDTLYGRGAVDMKGAIACFVAAALDHVSAAGGPKGSLSFLITGDEEDIAVNGTVKLLKWAAERGETFDHCILGEPLMATLSSSPVIRNEIEPPPSFRGLPPLAARWSSAAATLQAIAPFMSTAPRPNRTPSAMSPANGSCDHALMSPGGTTSVCPANIRCGEPVPNRA